MSELTEYLAHKYNKMSKESKSETGLTYNQAYLGGYRQCVVDAQEYKPTLNENQQIVFEWLKEERTKNPELTIFGTLSVLFDESENRCMNLDVIDALNELSNSKQAGVFQAFSQWVLEWEEE